MGCLIHIGYPLTFYGDLLMEKKLRILFVTSEHPDFLYSGLGTFTRDYVCELKKYCDVFCVYFHLTGGIKPLSNGIVDLVLEPKVVFNTFTSDAKSLEVASSLRASLNSVIDNFKPDVIHCNDKQTYLPFRFDKNVFYSSLLFFAPASIPQAAIISSPRDALIVAVTPWEFRCSRNATIADSDVVLSSTSGME